MFKINKNSIINFISCVALSTSLTGLTACDTSDNYHDDDSKKEYSVSLLDNYGCDNTLLYYNDGIAILIPCDGYLFYEGLYEVKFGLFDDVTFSANNIIAFEKTSSYSSYEQAYSFALALTDEIYNYEDVIEGNYNNIALDDKIRNEFGISKKKTL